MAKTTVAAILAALVAAFSILPGSIAASDRNDWHDQSSEGSSHQSGYAGSRDSWSDWTGYGGWVGNDSRQSKGKRSQSAKVQLMVMEHLCTKVDSERQLEKMSFPEKEAHCPTVVMHGDEPTPGTVSGGHKSFDFYVHTDNWTNAWKASESAFHQHKVCEPQMGIDANKDARITADTCLDASHYGFPHVPDRDITVHWTKEPDDTFIADAVATTPGLALINETIRSIDDDEIRLEANGHREVMLHVFHLPWEKKGSGWKGNHKSSEKGEWVFQGFWNGWQWWQWSGKH